MIYGVFTAYDVRLDLLKGTLLATYTLTGDPREDHKREKAAIYRAVKKGQCHPSMLKISEVYDD